MILNLINISLTAFQINLNDNTNDISRKIEEFNNNKAIVYHRQYLNLNEEKAIKQFYGDIVFYDVFRGDGKKVKLSTLVKEMGNEYLYKNLLWGEVYYGFLTGLIVSIVSATIMDLIAISLTLIQEKIYIQSNPFENNPNLILGISLLGSSIVPITGIFLFSFFLAKSSPYHMNIIQAQSIVTQYNEFLKKKLGISFTSDILYNYKDSNLYFVMKIKF